MNVKEYISLWFKGIIDADKVAKKLERGKLNSKEGLISIGLFSLIIGVIFSALIVPFSKNIQSTIMILIFSLILLPFISMIGLGIFSVVLSLISKATGGKANSGKIMGLFGIVIPMIAIASAPAMLLGVIGAVTKNIPVYYLAMGIGVLITSIAGSIVNAVMLQSLSRVQKTSLPKAGMVYGATTGALMAVFFLLMAVLMLFVRTPTMM